ncbi:cell wall protein, partial [Streptomyces carpinensis]
MEEFSLPEDITALSDDELDALLEGAVKAFDAKAGSSTVTTDDLAKLRELATAVDSIRTEKAERIAAAEQA